MKYKVNYYVEVDGDEWLQKNALGEDEDAEYALCWEVLVEKTSESIGECKEIGEPVVGEVVYCNGLGTVRILKICKQIIGEEE